MTRRSGRINAPRDYMIDGEWPFGRMSSEEPAAAYAAHVAQQLLAALADTSKSELADRAQLARTTLYGLLEGRHWPDLVTLVRLEQACNQRLWPESPLEV